MPRRLIDIDGVQWSVTMSGRHTQYNKDEFTVLFRRVGEAREERAARYSPLGSKLRENSLAERSDAELIDLFRRSQPSWTTADTGYLA
jgi:hypothetical protein